MRQYRQIAPRLAGCLYFIISAHRTDDGFSITFRQATRPNQARAILATSRIIDPADVHFVQQWHIAVLERLLPEDWPTTMDRTQILDAWADIFASEMEMFAEIANLKGMDLQDFVDEMMDHDFRNSLRERAVLS